MKYRFGDFLLDTGARRLLKGEEAVALAPKEFQTLCLLVEAQGRALERGYMMQTIWPDTVVGDTSLGRSISVLRKHLGREAVEVVPRFGYRFGLPVTVCDEAVAMIAGPTEDGLAVQGDGAQPEEAPAERSGADLGEPEPRFFRDILLTRAAGWKLIAFALLVAALSFGVIRRPRRQVSATGAASRVPQPLRLAVLPFRNLSANVAESDYLRDGIADELTARLGELDLQHVQVLARSTTRQYVDTTKPTSLIASETGARYLLEGSVRFDENEAYVTAYLVNAATQAVVWSQVQQRPRRELASLEEEIANRVAANPVFSGISEVAHKPKGTSVVPEAHDAYLRGRFELSQTRRDSYQRALTYFEQAVKLDPSYAKGYEGIAEAYILMTDSLPLTFCYAKAHDATMSALQLDDMLSDAHRDLAWLQMYERNDPVGSEAEFQRALELNPDDARTHHWYASILSDQQRYKEALQQASIGYELDPRSAHSIANYGYMLVAAGQLEQGKEKLDVALALDPGFEAAWGYLGMALERMQRYEEAAAAYNHAASFEKFSASYLADAAYARAKGGDPSDARKLLQILKLKMQRREWFPAQAMAMTQIALGNKAEAREWLQRGVEDHTVTIFELNHEPFYSEMKGQPGFPSLVATAEHPK